MRNLSNDFDFMHACALIYWCYGATVFQFNIGLIMAKKQETLKSSFYTTSIHALICVRRRIFVYLF